MPWDNVPPWVLIGLAMAIIGLLLLRTQRQLARAARSPAGNRAVAEPSRREPLAPSRDAVRWEVEMQELARELSGRLDSKMSALAHLTAEADRAAARLEQALAAAGAGCPAADSAVPPVSPAGSVEPAAAAPLDPPRCEEVYTLADYGYEPAEIARRLQLSLGLVEQTLGGRDKPS